MARLHPGERDMVDVLEVRGAATRVLWYRDGAIVFGWVASTSLEQPAPVPPNEISSMGMGGPRFEALASVRCGHDVPLSVELGGVRTRIGAVRAEAVIEIAERSGAAARIHPSRPRIGASLDVVPAPGATFWVDDRALADCAAAPPEPAEDFGIDLGNFTGLPGPKKP